MNERLRAALADRYRIERELGQGGMATVYLAQDLKHDRQVAIKVLKPELAAVLGAERFVVEIKTTAALQHPHILPLFDSGETDGFLYYVMPFIDGETLRAKLDRETQFGIDEAVRIASQVADALDHAHRHGVIHRDIKPENILLHDGRPMVADFGIALAVSAAAGGRMTETGLSLGTPHYMSPEQATAEKEITGRSDIYSLASVLYEMLSGNPPHVGASAQQIIMKIIAEPAEAVSKFRKSVPPHVAEAIATALEKLPADRFTSAKEFAAALGDAGFRAGARPAATSASNDAASGGRSATRAAAGVFLLAIVAAGAWAIGRSGASGADGGGTTVRFTLPLPGDTTGGLYLWGNRALALSPDGERLVAVGAAPAGGTVLFTREMDDVEWREIPGTAGAINPSFSPDGAWLAFIRADVLLKMPAAGGLTTQLASVGEDGGTPSWGRDGRIVLSIGSRLATIPEDGGVPRFVPDADSAVAQLGRLYPFALDDGTHALVSRNNGAVWEIGVVDLASGAMEMLGITGQVFGLVDDILIYGATYGGDVSGIRFDARARRVIGDPVVLAATGLLRAGATRDGNLGSVSRNGVFAYAAGTARVSVVERAPGRPTRVLWEGVSMGQARYSPDGSRIVLSVGRNVWILDRTAGAVPRRMTSDSASDRPEWTADGKRFVFRSRATGRGVLMERAADGDGESRTLLALPDLEVWQGSLSPDGRTVLFRTGTVNGADIWYRATTGDDTRHPVANSAAVEHSPRFSPDGRWIAYASNESGRTEVYVRAFPISSAPIRISADGAREPAWSRDGRSLYYRGGSLRSVTSIIRATLRTSPELGVVAREVVLTGYDGEDGVTGFDVAPNGPEIVMKDLQVDGGRIVVGHGWARELRERFGTGRR